MEKPGINKEIDSLGRLVIPKEMRNLFKMETEVELVVVEEGVLEKKGRCGTCSRF